MFELWFRAFKCFRIWLQTYIQNVAQIIFYYHVKKQYLSCLNWIITYFLFQNMFWKNISCFWFWWKTYTKCCTNGNVILRVRRLSLPAICGWSLSGYDLENGRMSCKHVCRDVTNSWLDDKLPLAGLWLFLVEVILSKERI